MNSNKLSFFDKIKKIKGLEFIVAGALGLLIVVIILTDSFASKREEKDLSTNEYVSSLENRLSETLSKVKDAGKVNVTITVEGGNKTVIAMDKTTTSDGAGLVTNESPVLVGGKVVVLCEEYPEITGVLVVASGANILSVKMALLNATMTLLDIDADKVQILTGK